jgi:hypothetical protein
MLSISLCYDFKSFSCPRSSEYKKNPQLSEPSVGGDIPPRIQQVLTCALYTFCAVLIESDLAKNSMTLPYLLEIILMKSDLAK